MATRSVFFLGIVFLLFANDVLSLIPSFFGKNVAMKIIANKIFSTPVQDVDIIKPSEGAQSQSLTQKEYLIAVRNRLFAVEEQIWLHEYAIAKPDITKVPPLSQKKYDELLRARGDLLEEYPSTKLYTDLLDAQQRNMTYAAMYLERLISNFNRQLPTPMSHTNQILVLSNNGQVINLMRGQGAVHHRLLPANVLTERGIRRQFQHPTFSRNSKYVAFAEIHFKDGMPGCVRADAVVYEVPKDPKTYGSFDSLPLFDSGELQEAPFYLTFSPDTESLYMLCAARGPNPNPGNGSDHCTTLVSMDWGKFHRKDSWAGQAAVARFAPRKVTTLLQGSSLFMSVTKSSAHNATILAHAFQDATDPVTKETITEKAVWMLQKQDTGGVLDNVWKKISDSDPKVKWSVPCCHSAGGGDSVVVVEDGWLVSKALSRWKRDETGALKSRKLLKVSGQMQFLMSNDHSKLVALQEDINVGHYSLFVVEGEEALDPCGTSEGKRYELPIANLAVAMWLSPDSTKLLLLMAAAKSKEDVVTQKNEFRVGLNADMRWVVYNFPLQELREYEEFKPTPYFMKTYVPFYSQYAQGQSYNPWAPDSRSFFYVSTTGMVHVPLVGSKHCVGADKWESQGATFGTWSRE